ncbi:MAG TPA: sigma-70 family RNA polymerase sigma factor [Ktedonosporobacter sp.]|nr:sigma-70 family RNA polymerase sigma factor [Ktedonosporobacter sp.]
MNDLQNDVWLRVREVAEKASQLYAQGILTAVALQDCMLAELQRQSPLEGLLSYAVLMRLAQRICSRELCKAWHATDEEVRNRAFQNLRCHLERTLQHTQYGTDLQWYANAQEDVLHQTLETLHLMLIHNSQAGPDDPAAFLKWTQTILMRQAYAFLQKYRREACLSLEALPEPVVEQFVGDDTPVEYVLSRELQQTLHAAILSVRNVHYQQVLIYTYLLGVDERELARLLHVQVQVIYLWHHRALKALRDKLTLKLS